MVLSSWGNTGDKKQGDVNHLNRWKMPGDLDSQNTGHLEDWRKRYVQKEGLETSHGWLWNADQGMASVSIDILEPLQFGGPKRDRLCNVICVSTVTREAWLGLVRAAVPQTRLTPSDLPM